MDEAKPDAGWEVMKLGNSIQELIIASSKMGERAATPQGGIGTKVSYDVETVLSALCWAAANFIVQSGDFPTRPEQKRAAKVLERRVLAYCPEVERVIALLGPPNPLQSN